MRITYKQLKSLPVETISGTMLGHIHDLIIDDESQMIVQYDVRTSRLAQKSLLINREQIQKITAEKIIVSDNTGAETAASSKRGLAINPEPVAMRQEI